MLERWMVALIGGAALLWAPMASAAGLEGDAPGVKLAERMLETLGGRTVWARCQTIHVELRGYYAREREPWQERFWMSLEGPRGRFELKSPTMDRVIAWTPDGGWERDGKTLTRLTQDRHRFELEYWRRQPVVIFHRLARAVPPTRIRVGDAEGRFDVLDAGTGDLLAEFAVNARGEPIKWSTSIGEEAFAHVLGPLAEYGAIRLPAWGATISGMWRYEHAAAEPSAVPLAVSLEPPSAAGVPQEPHE